MLKEQSFLTFALVNVYLHVSPFFFIVSVCLRLQVNPENKNEFQGISAERGFADFIFAHLVLHIVVINFIG